ncbi:MAG: lamin tail domain-containing protein [Bryobacterales bacterium]|nr:lamin tail domain-containing protein [Bryobacterales bacterium]
MIDALGWGKANLRAGLLLLLAFGLTAMLPAQLRISQVYGGGGNSGAPFTNDFVEIFNAGSTAASLSGLTVQYASATGTGNFSSNSPVALSGTLAPGQYYLVQLSGGSTGVALPAPDATGTINMSGTSGKVVLVNSATGLACNGGSTACSAAQTALILDLVGYGSANFFEGSSAAPTLSNTTAAFRANGGCQDTNVNGADFAALAPVPRNGSSAASPCTGGAPLQISGTLPNGTVGVAYSASLTAQGGTTPYASLTLSFAPGGLTLSPGTGNASATISGIPLGIGTATVALTDGASSTVTRTFDILPAAGCTLTHTISQIQGSGISSPLVGNSVSTRGVVTGRKSNGFFFQSDGADVDGDASTSEGLFVFTSSAPPAAAGVGNRVCVSGNVLEFVPSAAPFQRPLTQIGSATVTLLDSGVPLPAPVAITSALLTANGGIDQLERFEGMRVSVENLAVVAPTQGSISEASDTANSNGVFFGVLPLVDRPFREPGMKDPLPLPKPTIGRFDANPELIRVDSDGAGGAALEVSTGQIVASLTGPLDFGFNYYTVLPEAGSTPAVIGSVSATPVPQAADSEFTIASFNVQRLFDTVNDPGIGEPVVTAAAFEKRLGKISQFVRNLLRNPDITGMVEVENLSTLQDLATRINSDNGGATSYVPYLSEGNDIGGIDVGFLVNVNRVQVDGIRQEGKATVFINPVDGSTELLNDRPPLVLEARVRKTPDSLALPVVVVVNHLRSFGDVEGGVTVAAQNAALRARTKRARQAEFLASMLQAIQAARPGVPVVSVGDYNAYEFNDGYADILGTILGNPAPPDEVDIATADLLNPNFSNLIQTLPAQERYTYSFDGSAQVLDHILVSTGMLPRVGRFAVAHGNADFASTLRNDPSRPERVSDHDVPIAYFRLPSATVVSDSVRILRSGALFDRRTGRTVVRVTLSSLSGVALGGPLHLLISGLPSNFTLQNATGNFAGTPYITLPSGLAPGATVIVALEFTASAPGTLLFSASVAQGEIEAPAAGNNF